jgi:hypothetical protein
MKKVLSETGGGLILTFGLAGSYCLTVGVGVSANPEREACLWLLPAH